VILAEKANPMSRIGNAALLMVMVMVLGLVVVGAASGQSPSTGAVPAYPVKLIRIITTVPGGSLDLTGRIIAPKLSERLSQPIIIDNRGGILSMELVAKVPPDGYTLLIASASLWTSQFLRDSVPWDPLKDYAPVTLLVISPNILCVHPSLPVNSVKDLIALARARTGALNYASGQSGSSSHVAGELFKSITGTHISRVAYKGAGPALLSLLTGETQVSFPNAASVTPHIKSGKVKALAVTTLKPSALAPGLPTVAASGLPGYESKAMVGLFAPARTPETIIQQLNAEVVRALNDAEVKHRLFESGAEVAASSPAELSAEMKREMATMGKLLKHAGVSEK
jgi:tripartite-type tricarboxylate transporter receptor subunit TctC